MLQTEITVIAQRSKEEIYSIQGRLYEKEQEIRRLRELEAVNTDAISALSDRLAQVVNEVETLKKNR